ncbi:Ganglioside GM2 activator [Bulinus truncatus]|nr:Ganglioside GM2 activator [Bulinus truncatus]
MAILSIALLFTTLCLGLTTAGPLYVLNELEQTAYRDVKAIYDAILYGTNAVAPLQGQTTRLESFSFKNCADPSTEILVPTDINVIPDPISIPGNITISGDLLIKRAFGSPLKTSIVVEKEVLGHWIKIPCIDSVGSCDYDDMCTTINVKTCPPQFVSIGLPCKCPFPSGNFGIQPFVIDITSALPFRVSGGVRVQITATYDNSLVSCAQLELDLA